MWQKSNERMGGQIHPGVFLDFRLLFLQKIKWFIIFCEFYLFFFFTPRCMIEYRYMLVKWDPFGEKNYQLILQSQLYDNGQSYAQLIEL